MAQIVVDPQVLETKAGTIEEAAKNLSQLYTEMENEVQLETVCYTVTF